MTDLEKLEQELNNYRKTKFDYPNTPEMYDFYYEVDANRGQDRSDH